MKVRQFYFTHRLLLAAVLVSHPATAAHPPDQRFEVADKSLHPRTVRLLLQSSRQLPLRRRFRHDKRRVLHIVLTGQHSVLHHWVAMAGQTTKKRKVLQFCLRTRRGLHDRLLHASRISPAARRRQDLHAQRVRQRRRLVHAVATGPEIRQSHAVQRLSPTRRRHLGAAVARSDREVVHNQGGRLEGGLCRLRRLHRERGDQQRSVGPRVV